MAVLSEISRDDLVLFKTPVRANITEVEHLASYNWIGATCPTITVPGSPPVWSDIKVTKKLRKDSGHIFIAQNAARHPHSPLEPLFRALFEENPSFDLCSVGVISDRNNIRKLLSFVDPTTSKNGLESFTIKAEAVCDTVMFSREEALLEEFLGPSDFRGYGHEFERAYTTNEVTGSTGHHRIISYRFGDLKMVVRHETDGYVNDQSLSTTSGQNDLLDLFNDLSLASSKSENGSILSKSKLMVRKGGRRLPISTTLEIKTRVAHRPLQFDEVAPQLWVSQTPKLVRAYHNRGTFQVPFVEDVTGPLKLWEERNQQILKRLVALIQAVVEVAKVHGKVIINHQAGSDTLNIRKTNAANFLPEDLYLRWTAAVREPVLSDDSYPSDEYHDISD